MSNSAVRGKKPAVVMDLDETVFDNSSFQTFLLRSHLEYTEELWDRYERDHPQDVTPIPGALEFIRNAGHLGVHVVFLSNRSERFRDSTRSALKRLGLGIVPDERLLLKPTGASSDKTARRKIVATQFDVLMYVGDGLRDFSEEFAGPKLGPSPSIEQCRNAIAHRLTALKAAEPHLGVNWFMIPNPVYGEWDKFAGPDPVGLLHPTTMPIQTR
jgi:acid phosphatase